MSKNLLILFAATLITSAIPLHFAGADLLSDEVILVLVVGLFIIGVSFALALIPAGIYWLFKRRQMPHLSVVVWVVWGLLTAVNLVNLMVFK